jgi:uncharacterized DUF497 family protein
MPNPPPGFEWDERKAAWNLKAHNVSLATVKDFDFAGSLKAEDLREDYGETRIIALGRIGRVLHALIYTQAAQGPVRVISLRKATPQERALYLAGGGG